MDSIGLLSGGLSLRQLAESPVCNANLSRLNNHRSLAAGERFERQSSITCAASYNERASAKPAGE